MAAVITGMVITTIWQYRTTQSLTKDVQTLTKTVERMQMQMRQSLTAKVSMPSRIDTMYLMPPSSLARTTDTYPAPADVYGSLRSRRQSVEQPRPADSEQAIASAPSTRKNSASNDQQGPVSRVTNRVLVATNQLAAGQRTLTNRTSAGQLQSADDRATPEQPQLTTGQPLAGRSTSLANPTASEQSRYAADPAGSIPLPPESGRAVNGRAGGSGTSQPGNPSTDYQTSMPTSHLSRSNDPTLYSTSVANQAHTGQETAVNPSITASGPLANVQPLAPRPLADQSEALAESWQRHLRRVRYSSPYMTSTGTAVAAAEPAVPAKHSTPLPVQFRLGVGGDMSRVQSGLGIYAEAVIANRLTLNVGLSQMQWAADEYGTEKQFTAKTKRDFRRDYLGSGQYVPIGPSRPREVMNITRSAQSLLIPVQLGYRFKVGERYVVTPSVGLALSIKPRETVTFGYDRPIYRDEIQQTVSVVRPMDWYSSLSFGVNAERQWGRFVGQLGSVALMPVNLSTASLNTTSAGLRGRLFYQF
jgi:hypothetical protein